jgi:GR25 family glycosyltransferase involved in LPS biosynthesis
MNIISFSTALQRQRQKLDQLVRLFDTRARTASFSARKSKDRIGRIYVINLDRKPDRWRKISKELERVKDIRGLPLFSLTRRFSAVDSRYLTTVNEETLRPYYSLADQLAVEPNKKLAINDESRSRRIEVTPQEEAVALSHIEVWKLVASGDIPYTLVLEDDVYFRYGFARAVDAAWSNLIDHKTKDPRFDLLYLSYQAAKSDGSAKVRYAQPTNRPSTGIWNASGYVLTPEGARKLLSLLPVYGPLDLWLNLQFDKLDVLVTPRSIIEQRMDTPSTNSYSIMPVLSQVGVYIREKPLVPSTKLLQEPIFACGEQGSCLTALATALSMLGYTCCSDIKKLPDQEADKLMTARSGRSFNAYVNVGDLGSDAFEGLAGLYPDARFIVTSDIGEIPASMRGRVLSLTPQESDKWEVLCTFLGLEYPPFTYPDSKDSSPWIIAVNNWGGIRIDEASPEAGTVSRLIKAWPGSSGDDEWILRNDTFPSNLALFTPDNVVMNYSGASELQFHKHDTSVRKFTAGAVVSREAFLYGTFAARLRTTNVSGLVTGIFLHRNGPHQEIDIELLGKDTTKMLVNVFYNPGSEGTKLEYGYRGTPVTIDLGFDASQDFHLYEIEWSTAGIRWRVDGKLVYERVLWDPTPIPNLPMEFNVNLWHSRSKDLSGKLDLMNIPASVAIKSVHVSGDRVDAT